MDLEGREESENVEDDRQSSSSGKLALGGIGTLVIVVIGLFMGVNPQQLLNQLGNNPAPQPALKSGNEDELTRLVKVVLKDTEDVWTKLFQQMNKEYVKPKLVLFTDQIDSGCGFASAATGPFYCPEDQKVYIDLSFYDELRTRFGAPGDAAQAYVIAHEIGHHVQKLLGESDRIRRAQQGKSEKEVNRLSVQLELQADYLAGVWARHAQERGLLQPNEIEQAVTAANAIGDDRLQKQAGRNVVPDSFTHGTSAQRVHWLKLGYETGDLSKWDTSDPNR